VEPKEKKRETERGTVQRMWPGRVDVLGWALGAARAGKPPKEE
jgi:hypothetical protein